MMGSISILKEAFLHRFFYHLGRKKLNIFIYAIARTIEVLLFPFRRKIHKSQNLGEALLKIFQNSGPIYIKFGQSLSTRSDIVGEDIAEQLKKLQDKLPPFSAKIARAKIEAELGKKIEDIFKEFSDKEASAASIAQVHKATLLSGEKVAIKILRPKIHEEYRGNIKLLYFFAKISKYIFRDAARLKLKEVVDLSKSIMEKELDLSLEAASMEQIKHNSKEDKNIVIPDVFWKYTNPNILVTKWIDGISIYDARAIEKAGLSRDDISKKIAIMFFNQAYGDGFFHADLHPGNILVTKDGKIGLIDFGIVGNLPEKDRLAVTEILHGFLKKDYMRIAEIHRDVGYIPKDSDLHLFAMNCRIIGEAIVGEELKNISVGKILGRLFKITKDFGMETQPQLLLLQKTTIVVEGVGRTLNPELNMWKLAEPWVKKWAIKNISPEAKILRFLKGELDKFLRRVS